MILRKFIISIVTKFNGDGFDEAEKGLGAVSREAKGVEGSVKRASRAKDAAGKSARKLGQAERSAATEAKKLGAAQAKAAGQTRDASNKFQGGASAVDKYAGSLKGLLVAVGVGAALKTAVTGIFNVGKAVITTGIEFESLRARLKTVEGSADGAAKAFATIQDFAKTTPFELQQVTEAYVKLKSLGLDASKESLSAFGNIAAAQGKDIVQFIEAVADASTGEFERLKEFGIKASSQGDKVAFTFAGVTTKVGKNSAEIQEYLKNLGNEKFGDAMANQTATAAGMLSNLKDGFFTFLDTVAQMGVLDAFKALLGDISKKFGEGEGLAQTLAKALVKIIDAIRRTVKTMEKDDIEGAFETFFEAAKALAEAINLASDAIRYIIDLSGGFGEAVTNMTLVTVALVAAFYGPVGLVIAAGAAGAAIGNLLNKFGAADALTNFLGDLTGLNKQLAILDRLNGGTSGKRGQATKEDVAESNRIRKAFGLAEQDFKGPIKERDTVRLTKGGEKAYTDIEALTNIASGAVKSNALTQAEATSALEQVLASEVRDNRNAALKRGEENAAKANESKAPGKKGKKGKQFFDVGKDFKAAAEKQAEDFAQSELERLIRSGVGSDEAIGQARQAGRQRAKELEEMFRKAGKVFDASSKNILDVLGLRGPGSMLENRPPPQTLLITIAPIIKLIENLQIVIHGAGSNEERDTLQDAANQARDTMMAKLEDLPALVAAMFELQGKRLLTSHGGGRTLPGVG